MRFFCLLFVVGCVAETPPEVSWHADVGPMVERRCVRCHNPDGTGLMDLTTRAEVERWADRMLTRMEAGEMPPPVADPACRDYVGAEHLSMPYEEIETFASWVVDGMPEGKKADAPDPDPVALVLEDPDLELQLIAPYTPNFDNAGDPENDYRCFALEHGRSEPFYVTALGPMIDALSLVHHVVVFVDQVGDLPDHDPAEGWSCIDDMQGLDVGMVAGWAPGALPLEFPEGTGYRVEPDERIILQMHYYNGAPDEPGLADQSGYAFRMADEVDTELLMIPYGDYGFSIPAGDPAYEYGFELEIPETIEISDGLEIPFPETTVYATFPHMHVLGSGYELRINHADGTEECIVQSDQYDFDNQLTYELVEPATFGPGDSLWWSCTWNNSRDNPDLIHNPPIDIGYGERTDEEMCWAFTLVSVTL